MISWAQGHLFLHLLCRGQGGFWPRLDIGIREASTSQEWAWTMCQEVLISQLGDKGSSHLPGRVEKMDLAILRVKWGERI